MGRPGKNQQEKDQEKDQKPNPLAEAQKQFDAAQQKFDDITTSPDSTQEEKDAVKAELDDAAKLLDGVKTLGLTPPTPPSSETRKYHTLSCIYSMGRYPKLGLKFTNGILVASPDQYEAAKNSPLWNRDFADGTRLARGASHVKVVKEASV